MITKHIKIYSNIITWLSAIAVIENRYYLWCCLFMVPACVFNYIEGIEKGIDMTMKKFEDYLK